MTSHIKYNKKYIYRGIEFVDTHAVCKMHPCSWPSCLCCIVVFVIVDLKTKYIAVIDIPNKVSISSVYEDI